MSDLCVIGEAIQYLFDLCMGSLCHLSLDNMCPSILYLIFFDYVIADFCKVSPGTKLGATRTNSWRLSKSTCCLTLQSLGFSTHWPPTPRLPGVKDPESLRSNVHTAAQNCSTMRKIPTHRPRLGRALRRALLLSVLHCHVGTVTDRCCLAEPFHHAGKVNFRTCQETS